MSEVVETAPVEAEAAVGAERVAPVVVAVPAVEAAVVAVVVAVPKVAAATLMVDRVEGIICLESTQGAWTGGDVEERNSYAHCIVMVHVSTIVRTTARLIVPGVEAHHHQQQLRLQHR